MQLQYEKSWDKALASVDRTRIEQLFLHAKKSENFTAIREAVNHQETLLISVLIHNRSEKTLVFDQTSLDYELDGQHIAMALFTLPQLKIPPHTSMPWTFLFPKGSYCPSPPSANPPARNRRKSGQYSPRSSEGLQLLSPMRGSLWGAEIQCLPSQGRWLGAAETERSYQICSNLSVSLRLPAPLEGEPWVHAKQ